MKYEFLTDKNRRMIFAAIISLVINLMYGVGNAVIGLIVFSWWFISASAYYIILSIMRFCLVAAYIGNNRNDDNEIFIKKFSGVMLLCLAFVLSVTVFLTVKNDIGRKHHEIIMITIAVYTFTKLVFAIINFCKSKKINSPIIKILRNISLAEAAVSIFSLQNSMLISFDGMSGAEIRLMNTLTGFAICLLVFILGINLLIREAKHG